MSFLSPKVVRSGPTAADREKQSTAFHGHVAGAYENEDGHIVVDLTVADGNVFFWWPPDDGGATDPSKNVRQKLIADTYRYVLDPRAKSHTRVKPTRLFGTNGEFSRIDDRFVTKRYAHFWQLQIDPSRPYDFAKCGPPAGGLFNVIGHYNWDTGARDEWFAGPTCTFQEPVFVPRAGSDVEGDGYLMALLNRLDVLRNDILIFDALHLSKGPIAAVHLPVHLRMGLHGNFVEQREVDEWNRRRGEGGDLGPLQPATEPLPWQSKLASAASAAAAAAAAPAPAATNGANGSTGSSGANGANGISGTPHGD